MAKTSLSRHRSSPIDDFFTSSIFPQSRRTSDWSRWSMAYGRWPKRISVVLPTLDHRRFFHFINIPTIEADIRLESIGLWPMAKTSLGRAIDHRPSAIFSLHQYSHNRGGHQIGVDGRWPMADGQNESRSRHRPSTIDDFFTSSIFPQSRRTSGWPWFRRAWRENRAGPVRSACWGPAR